MGMDGFSKCHPAVNFLFFVGAIVFGVLFQHPAYLLAGLLCAGLYYLLLCGRKALKSMAIMLPLFLIIAAINPLFNTRGEHILFHLFGRPYTLEALGYGFAVGGILVITLLWFGCYNRVMTEDKFTALFGNLMPALSLLLVMVFRLIPALLYKSKQITDARRCIGKSGENLTFRQKISSGMTVLLALAGWSLESGILTADSMRCRGYGTARRTNFQVYRLHLSDWVLLAALALTAAVTVCGAAVGATEAAYVPVFAAAPVSVFLPVYCIFLLIPTIIHIKEVVLCRIFISKI